MTFIAQYFFKKNWLFFFFFSTSTWWRIQWPLVQFGTTTFILRQRQIYFLLLWHHQGRYQHSKSKVTTSYYSENIFHFAVPLKSPHTENFIILLATTSGVNVPLDVPTTLLWLIALSQQYYWHLHQSKQ